MKTLFLILILSVPSFAQTVTEQVSVKCKEDTKQGQYNDNLYYQASELNGLSPAQRTAKFTTDCHKRATDWQAFVTEQSSKPAVEPTKEAIKEQFTAQAEQVSVSIEKSINAAELTKEEAQVLINTLQKTVDTLKVITGEKVQVFDEVQPK